jgi:hypothetical protein
LKDIPLEDKIAFFEEKLFQHRSNYPTTVISLTIPRENTFHLSCSQLAELGLGSPLKGIPEVEVRFEGEQGVGVGVRKEWLTLISKEMYFIPSFPSFHI